MRWRTTSRTKECVSLRLAVDDTGQLFLLRELVTGRLLQEGRNRKLGEAPERNTFHALRSAQFGEQLTHRMGASHLGVAVGGETSSRIGSEERSTCRSRSRVGLAAH